MIYGLTLQAKWDTLIFFHLRTLSDGKNHPAARYPTIQYSRGGFTMYRMTSVSITGSRLAMFGTVQTGVPDRIFLIVWDWKSGQVLFVRQTLPKIWQAKLKHSHRISEERCTCVEFIDDHRLLLALGTTPHTPPSLAVMDTGKDVGGCLCKRSFTSPPNSPAANP